jgi:DNA-binding response OmpR family regulator
MAAKKILLVEDDKIFARFLEEFLEDFELQVAVDGIYGLKIARQTKPDLVIIDLNLPRMGGEEMISHLKQDTVLATVPVVVISGTLSGRYEGDPEISMKADAVFSKPFDLAKMRKRLDELIA